MNIFGEDAALKVNTEWYSNGAPIFSTGGGTAQLDAIVPTGANVIFELTQVIATAGLAYVEAEGGLELTVGGVISLEPDFDPVVASFSPDPVFGNGPADAVVLGGMCHYYTPGIHSPTYVGYIASHLVPPPGDANYTAVVHGQMTATTLWGGTISAPYTGVGNGTQGGSTGPKGFFPSGGGNFSGGGSFSFTGAHTEAELYIDSSSAWTLNPGAGGSITFSGSPFAQVSVAGGSNVEHVISAPVIIGSKTNFYVADATKLALSSTLTVNSSSPVAKRGKGSISLPSFSGGPLHVGEGTVIANSGGGVTKLTELLLATNDATFTSGTASFSTAPAVLNLKVAGSGVIVNYGSSEPSPLGEMRLEADGGPSRLIRHIKDGYNAGDWEGPTQSGDFNIPFITSDAAQSATTYPLAIGYAEASTLYGSSGTFMGQAVDGTSALLKVTWAGDANLDGKVDIVDLGIVASNWQEEGGWSEGDFNYDGFVDIADNGLLSTNWQQGVGNPLAPSVAEAFASLGLPLPTDTVPEPSAAAVVLSLSVVGIRRRRLNRTG